MRWNEVWPVFRLLMPCPGFRSAHQSEQRQIEWKHEYCHADRCRAIRVRHNEFVIDLKVCDHVLDGYQCSFTEEISGFLETYYDAVYTSKKEEGSAFKRGISWYYRWHYTKFSECANCHMRARNDKEQEAYRYIFEFIDHRKRQSLSKLPTYGFEFSVGEIGQFYYEYAINAPNNYTDRFCSVSCAAAKASRFCPVCGIGTAETLADSFRPYLERLCDRSGIYAFNVGRNHCSRECCSLALHGYLLKEREERLRQENLKCVQTVKKVLSRTKRALRNRDSQEVLQSLKKEFAQAANSP